MLFSFRTATFCSARPRRAQRAFYRRCAGKVSSLSWKQFQSSTYERGRGGNGVVFFGGFFSQTFAYAHAHANAHVNAQKRLKKCIKRGECDLRNLQNAYAGKKKQAVLNSSVRGHARGKLQNALSGHYREIRCVSHIDSHNYWPSLLKNQRSLFEKSLAALSRNQQTCSAYCSHGQRMTVRGKIGLVQSLTFVNKQIAQRYDVIGMPDHHSAGRPDPQPGQEYGTLLSARTGFDKAER